MSYPLISQQKPVEGRQHLQPILTKGEHQTVEFKQRLNHPEKIAKTICSLANTQGGTLLIGIRDNRTIMGVDSEQEKYVLQEALQFYIDPLITVTLKEVFVTQDEHPFAEVSILVVEISESDNKPHKAKNKKGKWQPYIRYQDKTIVASPKTVVLLENANQTGSAKKALNKNQRRLIAYLKKNDRITQKEYTSLVNISDRRARRELLEALDMGILRVLEHEKEDYYFL